MRAILPVLLGVACALALVPAAPTQVVDPAGSPSSDVLSPVLAARMASAAAGTRLEGYLVMADRLRPSDLDASVRHLAPRARRPVVAGALRAHAERSQADVRAVLDAAADAGRAEVTAVLWMGNAILFEAEADVIEALAALPGVDRIRELSDIPVERQQDVVPAAAAATVGPVAPPRPSPAPAPAAATAAPAGAASAWAPAAAPPPAGPAAPPPPPGVGSYPFYDGFESGALEPHWTVATSGAAAVDVLPFDGSTGGTGAPYAGDYHCVMQTTTDNVDSTASITVQLDLTGQTDVGIRFRHKEWDDENNTEDAVLVSDDGVSWFVVIPLTDDFTDWTTYWVRLDDVIGGFGISFGPAFFVRFQWRDNFELPLDGFAFDEIEIGPGVGTAPPPVPEPNIVEQQAPLLWDLGYDGTGVLVGSIDSGTEWTHPDLADSIWINPGEIDGNGLDDDGNGFVDDIRGWDFCNDTPDITTADDHGTFTAGLMVGDGSGGGRITGMAPGATLVSCEVETMEQYWLAQQYLLDVGVDVVSSSYSYKWPDQPDYHMFRQLADMELAAGIVHANSIGNQGNLPLTHPIPFNISTPGNCPSPFDHPALEEGGRSSVIAVGGVDFPSDGPYPPSGRGPSAWEDVLIYEPTYPHAQLPAYWDYPYGGFGGGLPGLVKPDMVAFTSTVKSTDIPAPDLYGDFSGTSASTPQVGGALALLRQVQPEALPRHLSAALELEAKDLGAAGKDTTYGAGRLLARDAARRLVTLVRTSPDVVPIGTSTDIELFGEVGATVFGFVAVDLVTGLGDWNLATPFFELPPVPLGPTGAATIPTVVPNDTSLIGLVVWLQYGAKPQGPTWGIGPLLSVPERVLFTS